MKFIRWFVETWNATKLDEFVNDPTPYDAQIFEGEPGYVPRVEPEDELRWFDYVPEDETETALSLEEQRYVDIPVGSYGSVLGVYGPRGTDDVSMGEWLVRGGGTEDYIPHPKDHTPHGFHKY